ncbi:hypothetical protein Bca52824_016179 [Brassica carinata]|uniref:Uncharacterized protein n=1 Tax=Brassica carinata TaxID=52824 RepID=A0A8X7W403_BRACI|nr:hypothetical protein Bca52824_016179 [Brassica carinata]
MDPAEEKRAKREMEKKKMREHVDMTAYVSDSHYRIPNRFPCGARVIDEVSTTNNSPTDHDTYPGSRYFTCKFFENGNREGSHKWTRGIWTVLCGKQSGKRNLQTRLQNLIRIEEPEEDIDPNYLCYLISLPEYQGMNQNYLSYLLATDAFSSAPERRPRQQQRQSSRGKGGRSN